jgi:hypothetical protein
MLLSNDEENPAYPFGGLWVSTIFFLSLRCQIRVALPVKKET